LLHMSTANWLCCFSAICRRFFKPTHSRLFRIHSPSAFWIYQEFRSVTASDQVQRRMTMYQIAI
jgi:hypothetical protein